MQGRVIANNPSDLDAVLEAFERDDAAAGGARVEAYLPDPADPAYRQIAVELIRVDLERSWARGRKKRLDAYQAVTPELFSSPADLGEIAFEEYRLRRQAGEAVSAREYARRYAIDTSAWPHEEESIQDGASASARFTERSNGKLARPLAFPRAGDSFAGFELVEQLGRGAFGAVFLARQAELAARDVVLKITAPRSVEPQRLARLQHTNIVPLYSLHEDAGLMGLCMPFFGRQTLADVTRGRAPGIDHAAVSTVGKAMAATLPLGPATPMAPMAAATPPKASAHAAAPLEVATVVERIAQLAEGLAHAHGRGIVHCDLKPANVLVTDDGVPMLLDFNLSSDTSSRYQKATLLVGGTLPYMAPEHLLATLHGSAVPPASDVFSLGVIAYELLTGQRPFRDQAGDFEETVERMVADRRQPTPSVRRLNPRVSEGLAAIVERCLAPEVCERYTSAGQLAEDLRRHQSDLPLRFAPERSLRERCGKWARRNARGMRWAVAATLVGVAVTLGALYAARQQRLAELELTTSLGEFERDAHAALANLYAPGAEPELLALGRAAAERAVDRFGLLNGDRTGQANFARLAADQKAAVRQRAIDLLYALAALQEPSGVAANVPGEQRLKNSIGYNAAALALAPSQTGTKALIEQRIALLEAAGDASGAAKFGALVGQAQPGAQDEFLYAVSLFDRRQYQEALAAAEHTCRANPQDPLRWLLLGNANLGVGRLVDAEACYTALVALQPKSVSGYLYRGLCRSEQGDLPGAEEDYSAAVQLNPRLATIRINRALTYYRLGNFAAAEQDATAALEMGLADPRGYFVRALIRDALGKRVEAQADRQLGFTIPPLDDKGWSARGMAALAMDPQRAAREFEQGLAQFPKSRLLLKNLAHVYGDRLSRPQDALRNVEMLVELSPHDSAALSSRAVLRARSGDVEAALHDATQAAANQPSAITSLQLACVYALVTPTRPEEANEALRHLQRALARDPKLGQRAATDVDLAALRENADFQALLAAAAKLTTPERREPLPAAKRTEDTPAAKTDDANNHPS